MNKYYKLLGLHLEEVKDYFDKSNINYTITVIQGNKDKDKLIYPRVIKINENKDKLELFVTYFSGSLTIRNRKIILEYEYEKQFVL